MADKTIWDYINSIQDKKEIDFNPKICSSYMLTLHFSHDNNLIHDVNEFNKIMFNLQKPIIGYNYFYSKIPKGRRFIKWPKKAKAKKENWVEELMLEKNISKNEALMYREFYEGEIK